MPKINDLSESLGDSGITFYRSGNVLTGINFRIFAVSENKIQFIGNDSGAETVCRDVLGRPIISAAYEKNKIFLWF